MYDPSSHAVGATKPKPPAMCPEESLAWKDKCLYMCVADYGETGKVEYTAYSINLKDMLSSVDSSLNTVFKVYKNDSSLPKEQVSKNDACAGFGIGLGGSTLFLAGGFRATRFKELVVPNQCCQVRAIQISDKSQSDFAPFLIGKVWPLIWEVEGKLFALSSSPPPPPCNNVISSEWNLCFEMYDPASGKWILLPDPPSHSCPAGFESFDNRLHYYTSFSHAILGSQLFVSNPLHPDYTYKCNLSNLHSESPLKWQVSPFRFQGATLGVCTDEGHVVVFSHDVRGPSLPEYAVEDEDDPYFYITVDLLEHGSDESITAPQSLFVRQGLHDVDECQFVHLGGQQVTFLCSTRVGFNLSVSAITFEFKLEKTDDSFKLHPTFYPTREWQFDNKEGSSCLAQIVNAVVGKIMK